MNTNSGVPLLARCRLEAKGQDELFSLLANPLAKSGFVAADYADELAKRERSFPTGLPVGIGVAIPHTDASFVTHDALVFATLKDPIAFGTMGGISDDTVLVSLVVLLALADGQKHLRTLQQIIIAIQDEQFTQNLMAAGQEDEILRIAAEKLSE